METRPQRLCYVGTCLLPILNKATTFVYSNEIIQPIKGCPHRANNNVYSCNTIAHCHRGNILIVACWYPGRIVMQVKMNCGVLTSAVQAASALGVIRIENSSKRPRHVHGKPRHSYSPKNKVVIKVNISLLCEE